MRIRAGSALANANARNDVAQARIAVHQERLDTLLLRALPEAKPVLALPAPQQLPVIQWLDNHHIKLLPWQEGHFGKACVVLSRERGRSIGAISSRQWRDAQGNWKSMGTYDPDIIEEAWASFQH